MQNLIRSLRRLILVFILFAVGGVVLSYYTYIFSTRIKGEVLDVERVTQPAAVIGGTPLLPEQMYSFAVLIRGFDGIILTGSSEDRKWAVARRGYCVEATFYPYPPWNLEKAGTFHNVRLDRVFDCKKEAPADWRPSIENSTK